MTADRDLNRLLDGWLSDGPTLVADRVIDDVAARIVRQPQRPAWRLRPWRFPMISTPRRLALIGAALLATSLAGGLVLFGGGARSTTPPSTPQPSATLSPTAAPSATPIAFRGETGIAAGTYAAELVAGRLTFTLQAGWSSADVSQFDFTLHRDAGSKDDTVKVFTDMRRASKDSACTEVPERTAGATASELALALGSDRDLVVNPGGSIDLPGLRAEVVDVSLAPGVTRTCPFSQGKPSVPLVVDTIPGTGPFWGIGPNERIRLVIADGANGHNVVVAIDSADGTSFDGLTNATMPIVQSFAFEAAGPSSSAPTCEDDVPGCVGLLEAGSHHSNQFQPSVSFATPAGWKNVVDAPTIYKLDPASSADPYLIIWSKPAIPDGCGPAVLPGSKHSRDAFVEFVTHHPGVEVLSNTAGTLGAWTTRTLDLRVKDTYTKGCAGIPGNTVQLIVDDDPLAGAAVYGVASSGRMRIVLVDVTGQTVIVQAYGPDSDAGFAEAMATVQPLIDSFQFAPAN